MELESCNNQIACEPFKGARIVKESRNGVTLPTNKLKVEPLKVVFGNEKYPTNSTIYVIEEARVHGWAKCIHDFDTGNGIVKFILVPESMVVLKETIGQGI